MVHGYGGRGVPNDWGESLYRELVVKNDLYLFICLLHMYHTLYCMDEFLASCHYLCTLDGRHIYKYNSLDIKMVGVDSKGCLQKAVR